MKKSNYRKKKGSSIEEAMPRYRRTRTANRRIRLKQAIEENPQFQSELRQLKQNYSYPDLKGWPSDVVVAKLNNYTNEWTRFCDKWNIQFEWLKFNRVVAKSPFKFSLRLELVPITKDQFKKEKLSFEKIVPVLIKTGYVSKDLLFTKKSLRLDGEFKKYFPGYTKTQFHKIEGILTKSCRSIPSIEAVGTHTEQEFKDMEPIFTRHSLECWGTPPVRSGRKTVIDRNYGIYDEYKKRRKKRENAVELIVELANQHDLSTETIKHIVRNNKFDRKHGSVKS